MIAKRRDIPKLGVFESAHDVQERLICSATALKHECCLLQSEQSLMQTRQRFLWYTAISNQLSCESKPCPFASDSC